MKPIDFLNAAFANGQMPNSEGLVDHAAAVRMGYRIGEGLAEGSTGAEEPVAEGEAGPETLPVPAEPGSEWGVTVVRITGFTPIDGADFITVANFSFEDSEERNGATNGFTAAYPVVVRKETYREGDKAVYVPVDSVLPDAPEFDFLGSSKRRLRAKRLRGVYSEGLLVPWNDFAAIVARTVPYTFDCDAAEFADKTAQALDQVFPVGADVADLLGITRYREFLRGGQGSGNRLAGGKLGPDESVFPYYSVSNARKGEGIQYLAGDTRVIVTEKLHGANIRFGWVRDAGEAVGESDGTPPRFRLGSHRTMRDPSAADWFGTCYQANNLEEATADLSGLVFYGEVLGVQDLTYGSPPAFGLRIFDLYDTNSERWCHWGQVVEACKAAGFDHVPVLYDGPLNECNYAEMAEGETCLTGASHVREGVVIRTYAGGGPSRRWKYVGQGYKLRKNQKDLVTE